MSLKLPLTLAALCLIAFAQPAHAVSLQMSTDKTEYAVGENIVLTLVGDTTGGGASLQVFVDVLYSNPTLVTGFAAIATQAEEITSFNGFLPWLVANPACDPNGCVVLNQLAGVTPFPPDPAFILGELVIPTAAEGELTIFTDFVDWFGAAAPPPVTVTIGPVGPGEAELSATKSDEQLTDEDGDGAVDGGDRIRYTVVVSNTGDGDAANVSFSDTPDANTTLVVGSVAPSQGNVTSGNVAGDTSVAVDLGAIPAGGNATVVFDVEVVSPVPEGVTSVANQGLVGLPGGASVPTDDPDTPAADDPTATPVESALETCQEEAASCDADLGVCEGDLGTCVGDLGTCESDLAACQDDPPFEDLDGDGEHDDTDACPATPAGEAVDAAGCSLAEFCAALAVPDVCNHGDWGNDEHLGNAQDCKASGGVCEPRL